MSRPLLPLPGLPGRHGRRTAERGRAAVVVLAGGSGSRLGSAMNKVYLELAGRRVISWSLNWARQVHDAGTFVLVVRPEDAEIARHTLHREANGLPVNLVIGGPTRHGSEEAALAFLAGPIERGDVDVVVIHDGARPLAGPALWRSVIESARTIGGAVPALPVGGILRAGPDGHPVHSTAPMGRLVRVQTPQAFRAPELLAAFDHARIADFHGTDTAATVEHHRKLTIKVVEGTRTNLKITYPHDLFLAEHLLASNRFRLP